MRSIEVNVGPELENNERLNEPISVELVSRCVGHDKRSDSEKVRNILETGIRTFSI
jgi:hypothetical protein